MCKEIHCSKCHARLESTICSNHPNCNTVISLINCNSCKVPNIKLNYSFKIEILYIAFKIKIFSYKGRRKKKMARKEIMVLKYHPTQYPVQYPISKTKPKQNFYTNQDLKNSFIKVDSKQKNRTVIKV